MHLSKAQLRTIIQEEIVAIQAEAEEVSRRTALRRLGAGAAGVGALKGAYLVFFFVRACVFVYVFVFVSRIRIWYSNLVFEIVFVFVYVSGIRIQIRLGIRISYPYLVFVCRVRIRIRVGE